MAFETLRPRLNPCDPEEIFRLLPPLGADTRLLDLGCGGGSTLSWLAAHTPWLLWGADADLSGCRVNWDRVTLAQSPAERLPFADAAFDAVLMECVFSLCEPRQCLAELRRILRPGGLAAVTDLFARRGDGVLVENSAQLRRIDREEELLGRFAGGFRLRKRQDFSAKLAALAGQMLLDGDPVACLSGGDLAALRSCRAGYGFWLFERL